jgi:hypothetical protein
MMSDNDVVDDVVDDDDEQEGVSVRCESGREGASVRLKMCVAFVERVFVSWREDCFK